MTEEKNLEAATSSPESTTTAKDENYTFYRENRGIEYTAEEEKNVLRKIDLQLIPILFVIYLINVRSHQCSGSRLVCYLLHTDSANLDAVSG